MKFRKKPVAVEAIRWFKNGDHPLDYSQDRQGFEHGDMRIFTGEYCREHGWEGAVVRYYRSPGASGPSPCRECGVWMHYHGWIDTREGGYIVCPGDWVITGVKGEMYPVKDEIFRLTYEPAE